MRRFKNVGASTRYGIWLCALLALVLVPAVTSAVLSLHAPAATDVVASPVSRDVDLRNAVTQYAAAPANLPISENPALPADVSWRIAIPQAFTLAVAVIWALFGALRAARLLRDYARLARVRGAARRWATRYGHPVLLSASVDVPLAIGFWRPAVLLPETLVEEYTSDALDAIVLHEVAHIQRLDVWTNALTRVLEIALALNPAAWLIVHQLTIERENACDDAVVMQLGSGDTFAKALAKFALSDRRGLSIAVSSAGGSCRRVRKSTKRRGRVDTGSGSGTVCRAPV